MWIWFLVYRRGVVRVAAVVGAVLAALTVQIQAAYPWYLWIPIGLAIYVGLPIAYGAVVKMTDPASFDREVERVEQDIAQKIKSQK